MKVLFPGREKSVEMRDVTSRSFLSFALRVALFLVLTGGSMFASGITVGNNNTGNCYPFLCFASDGGTVYQEQFLSSAFSGETTITQFSLFNRSQNDSALMDPATFVISFSTDPNTFGNDSSTLASNVGADAVVFGTYHLQGTMPDVLTLVGTAFTYNPANGNLLMSITVSSDGSRACPYCSFFEADGGTTVVLRNYTNSGGTVVNAAGAPVVNFNGTFDGATNLNSGETLGEGSVPEPSSLALIVPGLAVLIGFVRRRKQHQ
jgi:hypothetical protein